MTSLKNIIPLTIFAAFSMHSAPSIAGENNKKEYIEVPGGLSSQKLDRMWRRAKEVCYDNEYEDINEDKAMNTMVCKQGNMSIYMRFDTMGFTIKVQSLFAKTPIVGGIFSSPRKHRKRMIAALLEAAG